MSALKRTLYLQAAVWAACGFGLFIAPRFVVVTLFGQPPLGDVAWLRLLGVHALGLAMFMVLVAHRLQELWWWTWAIAFVTLGVAAVVVLHAALGVSPTQSSALWWIFSLVAVGFAAGLLYGLAVTAQQHPLH